MTLVTLLGGFLPTALLFLAVAWWSGGGKVGRAQTLGALAEALVLSLLAALWFASLGSGGWGTLFLLLGLLVAAGERGCHPAFLRSDTTGKVLGFGLTVVRYALAGSFLAWRLG